MNDAHMSHPLTLRYTGPAVESGQMDAYETAAAIIAFGDYLSEVARAAHGKDVKVRTDVRAFTQGSFAIDFTLQVGGVLATLFSGVSSPKEIHALIEQSFALWKHLQGEAPVRVERESDSLVRVQNNHGVVNVYRAETLSIIGSEAAGNAAARFVGRVGKDGIDAVEIRAQQVVLGSALGADAAAFRAITADIALLESTSDLWLLLESPVFKDGNKWKFADDRGSFFASILDEGFLARVRSGDERFGCGDRLLVSMRTRQSQCGSGYKAEREIVTVHEHKAPLLQHQLFGE